MFHPGILDANGPPRDYCCTDITDDFEVVRADLKFTPGQSIDTGDMQRVGPNIFDFRPQGIEEQTQLLNMRLAGSVSDGGFAFGQNTSHNGIFSRCYGSFIQKDLRAMHMLCHEMKLVVGIMCADAQA